MRSVKRRPPKQIIQSSSSGLSPLGTFISKWPKKEAECTANDQIHLGQGDKSTRAQVSVAGQLY